MSLAIHNSFDRGWSYSVDGSTPSHVLAADYFLQAVPVPAGAHTVVLTYSDPNIGRGMERLNGIYARWSTGDMGTRATYSSGATTTSSSNAMRICLNSQRGGTTPNFIAAIDAH